MPTLSKQKTTSSRFRSSPGRLLFIMLFAAYLYMPLPALAQEKTLHGRVTTESGTPVIGATIRVKGTTTGTSTNAKGEYALVASKGALLIISSTDPVQKYLVKAGAGGTYIDQYMMRLAETYLLRAEAYVGLNQQALAADDINKVRRRSSASDVLPANVNLDYILDERLRELGIEEKRMLTLMRLGKWVERTRKYNPFYGTLMKDNYNLWPIPFQEIERNNKAVLEQNPGYN